MSHYNSIPISNTNSTAESPNHSYHHLSVDSHTITSPPSSSHPLLASHKGPRASVVLANTNDLALKQNNNESYYQRLQEERNARKELQKEVLKVREEKSAVEEQLSLSLRTHLQLKNEISNIKASYESDLLKEKQLIQQELEQKYASIMGDVHESSERQRRIEMALEKDKFRAIEERERIKYLELLRNQQQQQQTDVQNYLNEIAKLNKEVESLYQYKQSTQQLLAKTAEERRRLIVRLQLTAGAFSEAKAFKCLLKYMTISNFMRRFKYGRSLLFIHEQLMNTLKSIKSSFETLENINEKGFISEQNEIDSWIKQCQQSQTQLKTGEIHVNNAANTTNSNNSMGSFNSTTNSTSLANIPINFNVSGTKVKPVYRNIHSDAELDSLIINLIDLNPILLQFQTEIKRREVINKEKLTVLFNRINELTNQNKENSTIQMELSKKISELKHENEGLIGRIGELEGELNNRNKSKQLTNENQNSLHQISSKELKQKDQTIASLRSQLLSQTTELNKMKNTLYKFILASNTKKDDLLFNQRELEKGWSYDYQSHLQDWMSKEVRKYNYIQLEEQNIIKQEQKASNGSNNEHGSVEKEPPSLPPIRSPNRSTVRSPRTNSSTSGSQSARVYSNNPTPYKTAPPNFLSKTKSPKSTPRTNRLRPAQSHSNNNSSSSSHRKSPSHVTESKTSDDHNNNAVNPVFVTEAPHLPTITQTLHTNNNNPTTDPHNVGNSPNSIRRRTRYEAEHSVSYFSSSNVLHDLGMDPDDLLYQQSNTIDE